MSRLDACIRLAAPGDAADLAALARRVFVATYGAAIPAPTLRSYFHEYMTPARFRIGELSLTEDFQFFVGRFFATPGEKTTHKKDKYHAAAG